MNSRELNGRVRVGPLAPVVWFFSLLTIAILLVCRRQLHAHRKGSSAGVIIWRISLSTVDILYLACFAFRLRQHATSGLQELHYGEQNHDLRLADTAPAKRNGRRTGSESKPRSFLAARVTNLSIQVQFLQAIRSTIWYPKAGGPWCADRKGRHMILGFLQRRVKGAKK